MTVKLVLLKSGETIITDAKEVHQDEKLYGYLFTNPQRVFYDSPVLVPEEEKESIYKIIGLGALKYFILKVDPKKRILFDS